MAEPPYLPGQFVWCNFPFAEQPDAPGPERHIGYVLDVLRHGDDLFVAAAIYTTTTPWPGGMPLPLGIIPINRAHAAALNQEPFVIDARRIAFMPVNSAFFPDLELPKRGIQGQASPGLKTRIENMIAQLLKRPELIQRLGPERQASRGRAPRAAGREAP